MDHNHIVLMVGPARNVRGGISSVVNSYYNSSLVDRHQIIYIASHVDGIKIIKALYFAKAISFFVFYLLLRKAKLVHIHCASRASFTRKSIFIILAKMFCREIIVHIHGAEFNIFYNDECNVIKKYYIRKILLLTDCIIVLSERWKEDIRNIVGRYVNIKIIANSVKLPAHIKGRNESTHINVLFVGRLGTRKGTYDLLKAAEIIIKLNRNVRFILCGDGDIGQVKNIISKKDLTQNIILPGWVLNKEQYFRNADIFVLPSYNEGLPMALLEAASYGLPIVSTPVGGISEVIIDGVNGFLIQPGDINALKKCLLKLINDKDLRIRMSAKARQMVKEKFNIEQKVLEVDNLYKELLEGRTII